MVMERNILGDLLSEVSMFERATAAERAGAALIAWRRTENFILKELAEKVKLV